MIMSMRLPTISQFKTQVDQMSKQYERVATLQLQVATGKKIQQSSDDPTIASHVKSVEDYIDKLKSYEINTTLAKNRLTTSSSILQESVDLTTKAKGLMVRAQNGTMSDEDRANIARELSDVLGKMANLANTQDGNGEYIFNGFQANKPAYAQTNGVYQYQGSYDGNYISISDQRQVQYSDSGFSIFGNIKSGTGVFSVSADSVNNTGGGVLQPVSVVNSSNFIHDDYTLTMVTNSAGQLAYQVIGASSGQVIPAPPLLSPDDAPEYVDGATITFNGITTQLDGAPNSGDTFAINQSASQSIFQTLQNVIDALNTPSTSVKAKADMKQVLSEETAALNGALNHLIDKEMNVAERLKAVDDQIKQNTNKSVEQQIILSSFADVDMTQAISNLTQQLTALEMSQQSYTKLQEIFSQLMREQFR